MNFKSLYVKILLSFLGLLFIAGILILTLFIVTAGKTFKNHLNRQSVAKLSILKTIIQEKADQMPGTALNLNSEITEMLGTFSDLFDVKIWLSDPNGDVFFQNAPPPAVIRKWQSSRPDVIKDGIKLYHLSRAHFSFYAQIPVTQNRKVLTLHILLEKRHVKKPEAIFLLGLLTIGLIIAILVVPLSRFITKRLKTLNQSALEFADGNLSCRTDIKGKDEIARLSESFNFMADRLEKMISNNQELTANISHELRSPLTRIRVSKELLQDKIQATEDAALHRHVAHIDQEIDVLDDLINKILKLSKIDLQTVPQLREPLDLGRILSDLTEQFSPLLDKKGLDLEVDVQAGLEFKADKALVASILSNLLDNAVKYTPEKGRILIHAAQLDTGRICFSITNPCRRLDETELEHIFDPFFRLKGTAGTGSGLGLTIVKKQVKQCIGSIQAKNSPVGLCFEVQLQL